MRQIQTHREKYRETGENNFFEDIIVENFPNLGKERDICVQESEDAKQH